MEIDELQPSDILLFSGAKDRISQAIMLLTDSLVTHSALSYTENDKILEETPPSVRIFQLDLHDERLKGRKIYVNRLKTSQKSMAPVLKAATAYLNQETPYANNNLYLLGLILVYKKWAPNTLVKKVMIKIFKKLTTLIIDYINKHKSPGNLPMVCSQFVYQCYEDAGSDYHLRINQGTLVSTSLSVARNNLSILDQVINHIKSDSSPQFQGLIESSANLIINNVPSQTESELAQELIEALEGKEVEPVEEFNSELALAVHEFGQAVYSAEGTEENAQPLMLMKTDELAKELNVSPALSFLKAKQAYFVTPEDLLNNCENVTRVGIIEF